MVAVLATQDQDAPWFCPIIMLNSMPNAFRKRRGKNAMFMKKNIESKKGKVDAKPNARISENKKTNIGFT